MLIILKNTPFFAIKEKLVPFGIAVMIIIVQIRFFYHNRIMVYKLENENTR